MKNISVQWIKHLATDAEKKEFEKSLRHSAGVLGRLKSIVEEDLKSISKEEVSSSSYDNPSWAYKQAHLNGERSRLTKVLNLLSFLDQ